MVQVVANYSSISYDFWYRATIFTENGSSSSSGVAHCTVVVPFDHTFYSSQLRDLFPFRLAAIQIIDDFKQEEMNGTCQNRAREKNIYTNKSSYNGNGNVNKNINKTFK